jgi:transcriptional regulator GlxA family with amidase domain
LEEHPANGRVDGQPGEVEDGNLITSRGAATSVDFGLALVRRLCGEAAVAEVAKGIMA